MAPPRCAMGACAALCTLPLLWTPSGAGPALTVGLNAQGEGEHAGSWLGSNAHMPPVRRLASAQHPPDSESELDDRPRVWAGAEPGSRQRGRSAAWSLSFDACVLGSASGTPAIASTSASAPGRPCVRFPQCTPCDPNVSRVDGWAGS